jgi:hypothetical protein
MTTMTSGLVRAAGGAVFVIALAYGICVTPTRARADEQALHLAAAPEDFARFGLGKEIQVREDGRRTPQSSVYFEWWYFDGLLDDGTIVVVWFGDNWLYGSHKRAVDIEMTPPGKATRRIMRTFDEPGTFASDHADIAIGPHRFEGDLKSYTIHVDASDTGGLGCDLVLKRRVPSYRPATGHIVAGDKVFAWFVAVPEGAVSGALTADGVTRRVAGSGYHDHNWGNVSPADLFDDWWWGRGLSGGHTIIASEIHAKAAVGGSSVPLFFIGDEHGVEVNAFAPDVSVAEGAPVRHPDPNHQRPIASGVSFAANGDRATFRISDRLLASSSLLEGQPLAMRAIATIMALKPWYSRFESPITLELDGQRPTDGKGALEYFELK